jgi:acylphosphatase
VAVEIEGSEASVAQMLDWLGSGPRFADVESVSVSELLPTGESGFRISS